MVDAFGQLRGQIPPLLLFNSQSQIAINLVSLFDSLLTFQFLSTRV